MAAFGMAVQSVIVVRAQTKNIGWEGCIYWDGRVAHNSERDRHNRARLRRAGGRVIRIGEHDVAQDLKRACARVLAALEHGNEN